MADSTTTSKTSSSKKKDADPDAAVQDAYDNLRQAMIDRGDDPGTVDAKLQSARPIESNVVGNFADLQRIGGMLVNETGGIADAVPEPPEPPTAAAVASAGEVS